VATRKPRVFIASSVEGLPLAEAVNANLDHETVPTIWKGGTFHLSSNTVDDLVKRAASTDFAVFVDLR
jgi:predicted nucleotide-binding protein